MAFLERTGVLSAGVISSSERGSVESLSYLRGEEHEDSMLVLIL